MSTKLEHLNYVKEKGKFTVDCSHAIFTNEEIEILEKWGNWFMALTEGELEPLTELQTEFIKVAKGLRSPFSIEEKAWFKYQGRKRLEREKGEKFNLHYEPEDDTFYSRNDVKKLRGMMRNVISKTHRDKLNLK